MVSMSSKKVCVIGAGVSGLASARELLREGHDVTVMEQSSSVGGQWLYDPSTDGGDPLDAAGAHSSMHATVRLISPRELTCFSDFPFFPSNDGTGDARRYPGHAAFLRYIRDFCDAFGLMDVVRLNTKVLHVGLAAPSAADDGGVKRTVRWSSRHGDREGEVVTTEEVFNAIVVAVGQYTQPRLPTITGMDKWSRRQLHSHWYRVPDSFHGEVVVVVGFHESGKDTALELSRVAMEVHVSVKSMEGVAPGVSKAVSRHHNLHLHLQVECLCDDGQVMFADGSCVVADSIIYCTGYELSFPFLDTGGLVTVDDDRVGPLFEHTFPPALAPSLSFVGLPRLVLVPLFYEVQARWVAQVLSGRRQLPSSEEMMRSAEEYHHAREKASVPRRLSHAIFFDFEYCDEFGEKHCGFPRMPEWKRDLLWSAVARMRDDDMETYRDSYHDDSDLVLEGLCSEGWLPWTPQEEVGQDEDDGVPELATTTDTATQTCCMHIRSSRDVLGNKYRS
ncbi:flavin-containing monooxygenase FMO GS-OX-like 8 [Miscanthus floridulus]|uniref:flavin-containing monooxygenase FMO GS-OX-like 8 n=1 Tax=Miscanthus floridulus TaxID=154761 RepID=UPI003458703E